MVRMNEIKDKKQAGEIWNCTVAVQNHCRVRVFDTDTNLPAKVESGKAK